MPQPTSPPFAAGAIISPRTLNRWLDVNPIVRLERTQTYIVLPTFSQAITWRGYSELVVSFNFTATNNFSLTSLVGEIPTNPNYILCIMWEDSSYVTHRYTLWTGVGEVFYFDITPYTGQLIKKNFRFEIWSTNSTPVVQATALTFYTSARGQYDYTYNVDSALGVASAAITNFNQALVAGSFPLPFVFPSNSIPTLN